MISSIKRPPDRPIRVLHVVLNLEAGGLERLVVEFVRRTDHQRFAPAVLTLRTPGRLAGELDGIVPVHSAPRLRPWTLVWPASLIRMLRQLAPDIVHTHSGVWYKAALAARAATVPIVIHTDHGRPQPDPWLDRKLEWAASWRTDVAVAVSSDLRDKLAREIVADARRLRVILNGVDTETYHPRPDDGELRSELGIGPAVPMIGTIGRLDAIKAYDVMLHAFQALLKEWKGEPPVLLLAGDGPERERLLRLARELAIEPHVRFTGWRSDVAAMLAPLAVFTLSSHSEGTSVSLLEAMSAGLCPVVTRVGGNPAVLGPDLAHRLVPAANPEALAAAWRTALVDEEGRRRDGAAARTRVLERYSLVRTVAEYDDLYAELVNRVRLPVDPQKDALSEWAWRKSS